MSIFPYYYTDQNLLQLISTIFVSVLIFSFAIVLICYLFEAIGMYTIGKNRGMRNSWLAFIPVANSYFFGSVADNINAANQKRSNLKIWLLVLKIAEIVLGFMAFATVFSSMISYLANYMVYDYYGGLPERLIIGSIFFMILIVGVSVTYAVFVYISCYKIFSCYSRKNAVAFTVLSILFGITPFLLFAVRNKVPMTDAQYYASLNSPQYYYQNGQYYQNPQGQQYCNPQQGQYPQQQYPQNPQNPQNPNQNGQSGQN